MADLPKIKVPTLTIGAAHDTVDPEHLRAMAQALPPGRHPHCPQGRHMAMHDDQAVCMAGLIDLLQGLGA